MTVKQSEGLSLQEEMLLSDQLPPNQTISVRMPKFMMIHLNSQAALLGVDRSRLIRHLLRVGSVQALGVNLDRMP